MIWIPKDAAAARTTETSRPLQLPTTLRRLGGAALADIAGPPLERGFSPYQSATRGGSCGPNITAVYRFLGHGAPLEPPPPPTAGLTDGLFGPAAPGVERWLEGFPAWDDSDEDDGAALFADQSKAFERMAWCWLSEVLRRWRMPHWLMWGLLSLVIGRRVATLLPTGRFILRILLCGLGMGDRPPPCYG